MSTQTAAAGGLGLLRKALHTASQRQDLLLVGVLLAAVAMIVLPVPAAIADMLIGCNIGVAVLLLMVAVYLQRPLDLTSLPGIILVSTVFRLALEVTVTRLILGTGDAGKIVEAFGQFVIAGNLVVGLVVFAIITVVQFIVITKGTERVAEVGARFTLDALPGKQMSIDNDVRNGDIDGAEAKRRRYAVEQESKLHGAMDGAMKFVKGDAVAGLVIILINLVGGIGIGVGQRGLPIGEAMQTYSLLTVGDALISQIPALFLSITAAVVVTRVSGDTGQDLGRDMVGQLSSDRRALGLAALILLAMAVVPGFPAPVFLLLALAFGAASLRGQDTIGTIRRWLQARRGGPSAPADASLVLPEPAEAAPAEPAMISVSLSPRLFGEIDRDRLQAQIKIACQQVEQDLGIRCPVMGARMDPMLDGFCYAIEIDDVPVEEGELPPGCVLLRDDPVHLELLGIGGQAGPPVFDGQPACWVNAANVGCLAESGIGFFDGAQVIAARLRASLRCHAPRFIGILEAKQIVQRIEAENAELAREVTRVVSVPKLAEVLRRLLEEGVPIRNVRLILEALVEWGEREKSPLLLTEYVRAALARQICYRHAGPQKVIPAIILSQDAEATIRVALRETAVGIYLALDPAVITSLVDRVRHQLGEHMDAQAKPVLLAALDVRRHLRGLLQQNGVDVAVLSYQDLAPDFPVQPVGSVTLVLTSAAQATGG